MHKDFFQRMTNCMMWFLVVPTALLLLALSILICSYACAVSKSNRITLDMFSGKLIAETLDKQVDTALKFNIVQTNINDDLINQLNKFIPEGTMAFSGSLDVDKITILKNKLRKQEQLLTKQKAELESTKNILKALH